MPHRQAKKPAKRISPVIMTHSQLQKRPFTTEHKTTSESITHNDIDVTSLSIQPKLTIGEPNDKYEKEADQVAAQVVQRIHSPQFIEEEASVQRVSDRLSVNSPVQRRSSAAADTASNEFEKSLDQSRSGGNSLSPQIKGQMESAMGTDFSGVKIHTDPQADQLSQSIQAKAFTTGQDVFFKQGEYNPSNRSGQELIAHELTHVVQQNGSAVQAKSVQAESVQRGSIQRADQPNQTGMPDQLKAGMENLSGLAMDDVKVHYNSSKPFEMGALAYAAGNDIHLAPKQEEHLAHEAWHVVQQKQGRVNANVQLKGGAMNDSSALEHEADVMGAKAAAYRGDTPSRSLQQVGVQPSVIQARLPEMSEAQIGAQIEPTREILLHSLRNMKASEVQGLTNAMKDYFIAPGAVEPNITVKMIADVIRNTNHANTLHDAYQYLITYTDTDKHFTEESRDSQPPEPLKVTDINKHLPSIVTDLNTTINNLDTLKGVFGVDDVSGVVAVYQQAKAGIEAHMANGTCPIAIAGNKEHNQWVGVGGMTSFGSLIIELSPTMANALAAGNISGKTTLVHELTHSKSGTKDLAYDPAGCAKLGPLQRIKNARTYEHGYLEAIGHHKNSHIYDADVAIGKRKAKKGGGQVSRKATVRKKKFSEVKGLAAKVWNSTDNAFLAAQQLANGIALPESNSRFVEAAIVPYKMTINDDNKQIVMSLIEDRTHAINEVTSELKKSIIEMDFDTLEPMESEKILAKLIQPKLNQPLAVAEAWVYYMADPVTRLF